MTHVIPIARPLIGPEEVEAVTRVLRSGNLAQGPEVAAFEDEFAAHFTPGCRAVAVNSGSSALQLGLIAAGIGPGDEVLVPSFTFAATANAVALTGATPVFVDIEPRHFTMSVASAQAAVTTRTAALLPVHLYGHPADLDALTELARRHSLALFEDAAQAHGARWSGHPVGTRSDFAMFSLYSTKNMTSGEGGVVTSASIDVLRRVRLLRNQGMERRYENELVGFNMRMTDLGAAIGREQLKKIDAWNDQRRTNAAYLDANLLGVTVPAVAPQAVHAYHQYTVRVGVDRDGFAAALLSEHGVSSRVYYPTPVHRLPSFDRSDDLPETAAAAAEVLSLPIHPALTPPELDRIVAGVNQLAKAGS